ncbi:MAG: hypothetical protein KAS32_17235 [Candidatus Peribacteraceae bacterium]|nr:hypothetical protein [Candidatus Peribacteraceae bacterium]
MSNVTGQKIKEIRNMTQAELEKEGWDGNGYIPSVPVLVLENGFKIFPSIDEEGNGGGVLFGSDGKESFYVMAGQK